MARTYQFVVGPHEARLRLDRYLLQHLPPRLSRTALQRAIREGAVTVQGAAAKTHRLLQRGEVVVARLEQLPAPSSDAFLIPEAIPLEIVYEDAHVLVVNKPPGLVTHPAPGHWTGTLVNAILWHLQQQTQDSRLKTQVTQDDLLGSRVSGLGSALPRAGIVHRLDKDTSGLLVVAKTEIALRELAAQLKTRTMGRRYLALVERHVAFDEGTIDASIGRHLKDRKLMTVRHLGGRSAVSHYRVLKRIGTQDPRLKTHATKDNVLESRVSNLESDIFPYTVLEVSLETGRTHQVRVHLAHLGHAVLGDAVYSRHAASEWSRRGIHRQLLHAYQMRFLHPATRTPMTLTAAVPEDMARWMPPDTLK